jgi:DNA repair exonuclease SbcCD nuclease subunit
MILFFSDCHLGIKTYSNMTSDGVYTAEVDVRNALNEIYKRSSRSDIDIIIFAGDFFHTSHPTTNNIEWAIEWFYRMDNLGKQFFLIPGNHDESMYSGSLVFINKLNLKNTKLINNRNSDFFKMIWNSFQLLFVPYFPNKTLQDKDGLFNTNIAEAIKRADKNTIIVSHIQEYSAKIGSESRMISKGVELLDIETVDKSLIILTGHVHRRQIYKKNHITIVYSGSTTFMDAGDLNQEKGFVLVKESGEVCFENLQTIRQFIKYDIPETQDIIEYFQSQRFMSNQVAFIYYNGEVSDIDKLYNFFKENDSIIGWIKNKTNDMDDEAGLFDITEDEEFVDIYSEYVTYITSYFEIHKDQEILKNKTIEFGKLFIENNIKECDFEINDN